MFFPGSFPKVIIRVENYSPENAQLLDDISETSKESTCLPKKKRTKARGDASVAIEAMTRLDKESVQKLQRRRETLIAQGVSESYPLQNSISPKLCDAVGRLLLLQDATDVERDMEKESDTQKFAQRLQKSEKTALELLAQQRVHDVRSDDVAQKLKSMLPQITHQVVNLSLNYYYLLPKGVG